MIIFFAKVAYVGSGVLGVQSVEQQNRCFTIQSFESPNLLYGQVNSSEGRRGLFFWFISFFSLPSRVLPASFCMVGDGSVVACIIDLLLFAND